MDLTVVAPPTDTSIDSTLVKGMKRITHSIEDDLIDFWILVADDAVGRSCNLSLMKQTLRLRLTAILPVVSLPRGPLISITSLKYTPDGGSEVDVDMTTQPKTITRSMMPSVHVPGITAAMAGEMEIEYDAGYAQATSVPPTLRQASALLTNHYFTSREAAFMDKRIMDIAKSIPFGVEKMIAVNRVPNTPDDLNGGY